MVFQKYNPATHPDILLLDDWNDLVDFLSGAHTPINILMSTPSVEQASQTNTQNAVMLNILAQPVADPVVKDAWNALTAEIIVPTGGSKYYVPAYFGALMPSGAGGIIWGGNVLAHLSAGATPSGTGAMGFEIDLNNYCADNLGQGLAITGRGDKRVDKAIYILRSENYWNRGVDVTQCKEMDFNAAIVYANARGFNVSANVGFATDYGFSIDNSGGIAFQITADPIIFFRKRTPWGAPTPYCVLKYYLADDANPLLDLEYNALWFGGGGGTGCDTEIDRSAANTLHTQDTIVADDGVATKAKAGTLSDSDFVVATTGLLGVDTTNYRIYFRVGSASWKYCAAVGGFIIPEDETMCPVCTKPILKDEVVCGKICETQKDGALHGVYVHLACACG